MAADGAGICGQAKAVGALLGSTWGHGPRLNDVSPVFKTLDAWICLDMLGYVYAIYNIKCKYLQDFTIQYLLSRNTVESP